MSDKNRIKKICGILIAALAVLAVILVFSFRGGREPAEEPQPTPAAVTEPSPSPTPVPSPTPTPSPTPSPEPEPSESPVQFDSYAGPDLREGEPVDDEFFADALFVGNSLVHGLWGFGGINTADYAAATSASVVNLHLVRNEAIWGLGEEDEAPSLMEEIESGSYGKVYLLLGINEIGFETPDFISIYSGVLDSIAAAQPGAEIYIMGLTPLTEEKDAAGYPFTMERVRSYNEALRALAAEREYYYVDLCEALADETGFMPEADSTDGVHLIRERYSKWADYLRCHYAQENV